MASKWGAHLLSAIVLVRFEAFSDTHSWYTASSPWSAPPNKLIFRTVRKLCVLICWGLPPVPSIAIPRAHALIRRTFLSPPPPRIETQVHLPCSYATLNSCICLSSGSIFRLIARNSTFITVIKDTPKYLMSRSAYHRSHWLGLIKCKIFKFMMRYESRRSLADWDCFNLNRRCIRLYLIW